MKARHPRARVKQTRKVRRPRTQMWDTSAAARSVWKAFSKPREAFC